MAQQAAEAGERTDHPERRMGWTRTLARLVEGRNISSETLLATDYLNHFNEIVMMIEMTGSMPDCVEDLNDWAPATYEEHFSRSAFTDKELAILAYENAPERYRQAFDEIVQHTDDLVIRAIAKVKEKVGDDPEAAAGPELEALCTGYAEKLRRLIDMASGVIHGHTQTVDQASIDDMLQQ